MGSMEDHDYFPSERDLRKSEAFFATPAGKIALARYREEDHWVLERMIRKGYVPDPEDMAEHEKWRARHSDLCAKLDKRK